MTLFKAQQYPLSLNSKQCQCEKPSNPEVYLHIMYFADTLFSYWWYQVADLQIN